MARKAKKGERCVCYIANGQQKSIRGVSWEEKRKCWAVERKGLLYHLDGRWRRVFNNPAGLR